MSCLKWRISIPAFERLLADVLFLQGSREQAREGQCGSQVFMDWRKQCNCWQPKGRQGFGNGAAVVCSAHYAQFFPVSWLSISLGSTKITWRYPSFFSAHLEDASPCCSCDSLSFHLSSFSLGKRLFASHIASSRIYSSWRECFRQGGVTALTTNSQNSLRSKCIKGNDVSMQ